MGYQPTGMKPSEWLWPAWRTWIRATSLLSALATASTLPSGERATLLGVLPGRAGDCIALEICSTARPDCVSNTTTELLLAQAT